MPSKLIPKRFKTNTKSDEYANDNNINLQLQQQQTLNSFQNASTQTLYMLMITTGNLILNS
jgi:hypothetical protein